jgi:hypothetical protein
MEQRSHRVYIGRSESGRPAVASAMSPYFLFEADSEEEAVGLATRALAFYFETSTEATPLQRLKKQPEVASFTRVRSEDICIPA